MMVDNLHSQVGLPLLPIGQFYCSRTVRTLVVAGGRHLQQSCHSGDRGGRALCGHQLEPVYLGWLAAKYAEAFFRNAMSSSSSPPASLRRANSVRSAGGNGSSWRAAAASTRRRSSATHRPSKPSFTPSSRATSAIVRPE